MNGHASPQRIVTTASAAERLMRQAGLSGLVPKGRGRTTIRVLGVRFADDLVERDFRPTAPNVPWVAGITTWVAVRLGGLHLQRRMGPSRLGRSPEHNRRRDLAASTSGLGLRSRLRRLAYAALGVVLADLLNAGDGCAAAGG